MATPTALIGRANPRTSKPYAREIREGLGGIIELAAARKERDRRLGAIRQEERQAVGDANGSLESAVEIAASLSVIEDPEERDTVESVLADQAEELETRVGTAKAVRWFKAVTGKHTPLSAAYEKYKGDRGRALSTATLNNLDAAVKELREFAGGDVCLEDVARRTVTGFVTECGRA